MESAINTVLCEGGCGRKVQVRDNATGESGWCFSCWQGTSAEKIYDAIRTVENRERRRMNRRADRTTSGRRAGEVRTPLPSVHAVHAQLIEAAADLFRRIECDEDPSGAIETIQHLINVISREHEFTKQEQKPKTEQETEK